MKENEMNKDQTHEDCRRIVELYLMTARGRAILKNSFTFDPKFVRKHKLEKRFQGHSYDILTQDEIIEIDDLGKHSKKSQIINDQIAAEYIKEYHPEYKFYRLLKEEIVDSKGRLLDPKDVASYLRENLF
jgi:hypothetical protein